MKLKRLWDTEHKRMVWAVPTQDAQEEAGGHLNPLQVWTNDDGSKLYVYDERLNRQEITSWENATASEYGPVWKSLEDEEVGYYLTNSPTNLYNWDHGDEVYYQFSNEGEVLESGTIAEGETPTYTGETPTKEGDAQYSYTFKGWKPAIGPIYKKTDFKAQYTRTVNTYSIGIESNDIDYGTVSESSVADVPYGTKLTVAGNVLTIGEGTSAVTITATPETGYEFNGWADEYGDPLPEIVEGDLNIVANFREPVLYTVTFHPDEFSSATPSVVTDVPAGTPIVVGEIEDNKRCTVTIGETEVLAKAEGGWILQGLCEGTEWTGDPVPEEVTYDLDIYIMSE